MNIKKIQTMLLLSTALLCGKGVAQVQKKQEENDTIKKIELTRKQWNEQKGFITKFKTEENTFLYSLNQRDAFFRDLFEKENNQAVCLGESHDWPEELLLVDNNGINKNNFFNFVKDSLDVNHLLIELPGNHTMSDLSNNTPVFRKMDSIMQSHLKNPTPETKEYIQEAILNYKQSDLNVFNIYKLVNTPDKYGLDDIHIQSARDAVTYISSRTQSQSKEVNIEMINNALDAGLTVVPIDNQAQIEQKTQTRNDALQWRDHDANYEWLETAKNDYSEIFENKERFIVWCGGSHIGGQSLKTTDELSPFTNVLNDNGIKAVGVRLKSNFQDRKQDFTADDLAKDFSEQDIENGEIYGVFKAKEQTLQDYTIVIPRGGRFKRNPVSEKRSELSTKYGLD